MPNVESLRVVKSADLQPENGFAWNVIFETNQGDIANLVPSFHLQSEVQLVTVAFGNKRKEIQRVTVSSDGSDSSDMFSHT